MTRPARPLYESQQDLLRERDVADQLSYRWNCEIYKMPVRYQIDWAMLRGGELKAFAELKIRNNEIGRYETFMISLGKWVYGNQLSVISGVPFLVVVRWSDGLFWHEAGTAPITISMGGRFDRNDSQDFEPMVHISTSAFKRILERSSDES